MAEWRYKAGHLLERLDSDLRKVHPPFFHLAFLVSLPGFLRSLFSLISLHII